MWKTLSQKLTLPGPVELGRSEEDALPSAEFTPFCDQYTWEDWDVEVQTKYPVRYFLTKTVPDFFRPVKWKFQRGWEWLVCHLLPSQRYHLVDLRGVDPLNPYTHGYLSPTQVIFLATWKSLKDYIETCKIPDPATWATPDQMMEEHLAEQKRWVEEARYLYRWWTVIRKEEHDEEDRLHLLVREAKNQKDEPLYRERVKTWLDFYKAMEERDEEMFLRVIKIRNHLW